MTLRYLKLFFMFSAIALLPLPATAETSEAVTDLTQAATLTKAGALEISQKIAYEFGSTAPHEISFLIPLTYHDDQGREFRMKFQLGDIAQAPGMRTEVTTATARITIPAGEAAASTREYVFKYTLSPVVLDGESDDILKFNVTGLSWPVPINHATLRLETPIAPSDTLTCYSGSSGSTTGRCSVEQQGNVSTVISYAPLQPGEGLNIFASFPAGSFETYLQSYEANPSSPQRKIIEFLVGTVLVALAVIGLATWLRRRYTNANEAAKDQVNRH